MHAQYSLGALRLRHEVLVLRKRLAQQLVLLVLSSGSLLPHLLQLAPALVPLFHHAQPEEHRLAVQQHALVHLHAVPPGQQAFQLLAQRLHRLLLLLYQGGKGVRLFAYIIVIVNQEGRASLQHILFAVQP